MGIAVIGESNMKNTVRIMLVGGDSYRAVVYGKDCEQIDEFSDTSIASVIAVSKKMAEIYKIIDIIVDMDAFEKVLEG
jgi:hypothetical protein